MDVLITSQIIGTGGGFNKTGAGVLQLTAASTFSGDTKVTADSLRRCSSSVLIALLLFVSMASSFAADAGPAIKNDTVWKDDRGQEIMCQGGNLAKFGDTFYFYGWGDYPGTTATRYRAASKTKGREQNSPRGLWREESLAELAVCGVCRFCESLLDCCLRPADERDDCEDVVRDAFEREVVAQCDEPFRRRSGEVRHGPHVR